MTPPAELFEALMAWRHLAHEHAQPWWAAVRVGWCRCVWHGFVVTLGRS